MAETKPTTDTHEWGGAFKAFGAAFERIKKNPQPALLFLGTYLVLMLVGTAIQGPQSPDDTSYVRLEDIASLIFLLAIPTYGLALADRKHLSLGEFMRFDLKKYLIVLAITILYGLIITGSFLLLIVPVVWTAAWFFTSVYVAIDKNLGPIESLKTSKKLAQSHKGKVWGIIGVSILLLLATLPLQWIPFVNGIATSFVGLVGTGAGALLYRWLEHDAKVETAN